MPEFTFSLGSDLHLDFPQPKTPPWGENIIIAGDCGNGLIGLKYLNKLKRKGHQVFAVDGNHEHYGNDNQGRTIAETTYRFYTGLDQARVEFPLDDLMIIGTNGWYPVSDDVLWRNYMNDGRYAGSAQDVNEQAQADALFLDAEIGEFAGKVIVVTHTAPTMETLNARFEGHYSNEWYWNPMLGEVLRKHADKILVWCHGHTHAAADKIVDGVRVVCNPRGYPGENPDWAPKEITVSW